MYRNNKQLTESEQRIVTHGHHFADYHFINGSVEAICESFKTK